MAIQTGLIRASGEIGCGDRQEPEVLRRSGSCRREEQVGNWLGCRTETKVGSYSEARSHQFSEGHGGGRSSDKGKIELQRAKS